MKKKHTKTKITSAVDAYQLERDNRTPGRYFVHPARDPYVIAQWLAIAADRIVSKRGR